MSKIFKKRGVWHFDEYFTYIKNKKEEIPIGIRDFVLDPERYLFRGQKTLHDSELVKLNFKVLAKKNDEILTLKLKGPYNTIIEFDFFKVMNINFTKAIKDFKNLDLIVHQFLFLKSGTYRYEFIFADSQKISIDFRDLKIREVF